MRVLKIIIYPLIFLALVVALAPKNSLYYLLEKELLKHKIVISNEEISDKFFYFEIKNGDIFYEDIYAGEIELVRIYPLVFWNKISLEGISIVDSVARFVPAYTKELSFSYSIVPNPLFATLRGEGDFGTLGGGVDMVERRAFVEVNATNIFLNYKNITQKMKNQDGKWVYEYSF